MTETVVNVQEAPNNNAAPNKPQGGNDQPLSWIKINIDYFKTIPGILKIAEFILGIFCMSLASSYYAASHYFIFVITFLATFIWIFVYLLGVREALNFPINWLLTEFVNTGISTVLYFIALILQLIVASGMHATHYRKGSQIAAGIFAIFNTLVYAYATYLLHLEWKGSRTNQ